jgi:uncharacterized membrane protein
MQLTQFRGIVLGLTFALAAGTAVAQNYTLNFLPHEGSRYWTPTDINNRGQVVGTVGDSHFPNAVTWDATQSPARMTYLPSYGDCCYIATFGNAINDRGQVAGEDTSRAALWNSNTTRPTLLAGEAIPTTAWDLNNSGAVVGAGGAHATLWDAKGTHDLGTLGGNFSEARAINEAGTVVGSSDLADPNQGSHIALWQKNGNVIDLGEELPTT